MCPLVSYYLHLLVDEYWITETSIVEGKVEIHTGASIIGLSYPEGEKEWGKKNK